jgi:hypothetical protein
MTRAAIRGLALGLLAWWAVFRWLPEDQPPSRVVFGPFPTREECVAWFEEDGIQPEEPFGSPLGILALVGCVELPNVP